MIGRGAYANFIAYATSKWGLEGFSQTLAAEARSVEYSGQFRRARLRRNQTHRLSAAANRNR